MLLLALRSHPTHTCPRPRAIGRGILRPPKRKGYLIKPDSADGIWTPDACRRTFFDPLGPSLRLRASAPLSTPAEGRSKRPSGHGRCKAAPPQKKKQEGGGGPSKGRLVESASGIAEARLAARGDGGEICLKSTPGPQPSGDGGAGGAGGGTTSTRGQKGGVGHNGASHAGGAEKAGAPTFVPRKKSVGGPNVRRRGGGGGHPGKGRGGQPSAQARRDPPSRSRRAITVLATEKRRAKETFDAPIRSAGRWKRSRTRLLRLSSSAGARTMMERARGGEYTRARLLEDAASSAKMDEPAAEQLGQFADAALTRTGSSPSSSSRPYFSTTREGGGLDRSASTAPTMSLGNFA